MEDYHVAKFMQLRKGELGLFAIYDGHSGDNVAAYLQKHLFSNILKEVICGFGELSAFLSIFYLLMTDSWVFSVSSTGLHLMAENIYPVSILLNHILGQDCHAPPSSSL